MPAFHSRRGDPGRSRSRRHADATDNCPDVAGSVENHGCPVYKKVIVREDRLELGEKIMFAFDRADIESELQALNLDPDTLRDEAAQLHEQLAALGPVNALAIEEHDEELKRLEFVTRERTDISEAKASLQQAIREIDLTAREMFLDTFTKVRENFRQIFMTLFGGGECDLRLENPDAPLNPAEEFDSM